MAIVDQKWSALPVPFAMELPDRVPQGALLRPRLLRARGRAAVAAGLADGVPARGDPAAARLRRVRVPRPVGRRRAHRRHGRAARSRTPAATAACKVVEGRGHVRERVHLPVPRLVLRSPTARTPRVTQRQHVRRAQPASPTTSTSCRCGARRGAAARGSTSTTTRRRCAQCIEPFATILDAWKVESLRTEWWYAVPPPGELEARRRGVRRAVPRGARRTRSSSSPARFAPRDRRAVRPARVRRRRDPLPAHDERRHGRDGARQTTCASPRACATSSCPPTRRWRSATWNRTLNDAVVRWHRDAGPRHPRPQRARGAQGINEPMGFTASRTTSCCRCTAAPPSYRFRPLGPEETLMEIWSLDPVPGGRGAGRADAARAVGVRRSALAADPRAGLLEPAAAAEGPAREGLRVHAPVRAGSRATSRTSSARSTASSPGSPTSSCSRRCRRST